MANETITSASGLRKVRVYALDSSGYPNGDQSGANGYNGIDVTGARSVSLNVPENQKIVHVGDDVPFAMDFLPPTELASGSLTTAKTNQTLDALLSNTLVQTLGEWEIDGLDTSTAGNEIDVCLFYWRQALVTDPADSDFSSRRWQTHAIVKARITPQGATPDQGAADLNNYSITPTKSTAAPYGSSFTQVVNGFTQAARLRMTGEYPIMMERYTGNATLDTFNLEFTPLTAAKTKCFVDGAAATVSSVNTGAKTFTLSAAPANAGKVIVLYETADSIT